MSTTIQLSPELSIGVPISQQMDKIHIPHWCYLFRYHLLSTRHFSKCFMYNNLFNPHDNPMRYSHLSDEETEF